MGLFIERISLVNFRNYDVCELGNLGGLTILVGPNAVGKTNILEAMQLLTAQTSFRHPTVEQLTKEGETSGSARAFVSGDGRQLEVKLTLSEGHKNYSLNGKGKHAADLKGLLPSVVFTPDDLEIAKGSMARRRDALDLVGCQLSKNHYLIRKDYEKVLQHKNRLLKEEAPGVLMESVNELMVTCGSQLCAYRSALVRRLSVAMMESYERISAGRESLSVCYVPSWEEYPASPGGSFDIGKEEAREAMERSLSEHFEEERERKRSLVGPHLDRIDFYLDGRTVTDYASQGQQRSVVLAFKMAEALVISEMLSQRPVMLLDDVMSELDTERRRFLVDLVSCGEQTVVTTTNLGYFSDELISTAHVVHLPMEVMDRGPFE